MPKTRKPKKDIMGDFAALMKFCQKCFREFPTEEEATKHEATCNGE